MDQQPGPGQYGAKTLIDKINNNVFGKNGVFGSTERRFVHKVNTTTPGPAQYNNNQYAMEAANNV